MLPPWVNYTRWEIGGEPQHEPFRKLLHCYYTRWEIGGEPQRACKPEVRHHDYTRWEIGGEPQPFAVQHASRTYYTRWEIGGEPQLKMACPFMTAHYTRWEIGGGNRNSRSDSDVQQQLYPMGDRGGTATGRHRARCNTYYTRWEIGGEPQLLTAHPFVDGDYTRWEIGGEPQRDLNRQAWAPIIPDGRSGGNRNTSLNYSVVRRLYPMGDRGGTAT